MLFLLLRITVDGFSKTNVGPMILEETFMDKTLKKTYHPLDLDGMSVLAVDSIKISELFCWQVSPVLWRPPKSRNPYNVKPFLTDISVTVAQIQKIKKTPYPVNWSPTHSTGPQTPWPRRSPPSPSFFEPKCIFPKCNYPKCIFAKCTRLACLLSFASLFL